MLETINSASLAATFAQAVGSERYQQLDHGRLAQDFELLQTRNVGDKGALPFSSRELPALRIGSG